MTTPEPRAKEKPTANGGRPLARDSSSVAPEPRVRVSHVPWENFAFPWVRQCDGCKERTGYWRNQPAAVEDARIHAMECDSLRLARLLRELEALRGRLTDELACCARAIMDAQIGSIPYWQWMTRESAIRWARANLTALIDRATDGGTGC